MPVCGGWVRSSSCVRSQGKLPAPLPYDFLSNLLKLSLLHHLFPLLALPTPQRKSASKDHDDSWRSRLHHRRSFRVVSENAGLYERFASLDLEPFSKRMDPSEKGALSH